MISGGSASLYTTRSEMLFRFCDVLNYGGSSSTLPIARPDWTRVQLLVLMVGLALKLAVARR